MLYMLIAFLNGSQDGSGFEQGDQRAVRSFRINDDRVLVAGIVVRDIGENRSPPPISAGLTL